MIEDNEQTNEQLEVETEASDPVDFSEVPGFHVYRGDNVHLGVFQTRNDAEAFINGHLVPQNIEGRIEEVTAQ